MLRLGYASALAAALLGLACAPLVVRMQTEAPPLAGRFVPRGLDAVPQPWPERWLVIAIAPEVPGPFDADVPDLAARTEAALRRAGGFDVVGRAVLAAAPDSHALAARAAEHGADGAVFARLTLREAVRRTHPLRGLAAAATFGLLPLVVAHDELAYTLELVAVNAVSGAAAASAAAARRVTQEHMLWQTAEGEILGWDAGEAIGGARERRRALEAEVVDALLAEAVASLLPRGFAQVPRLP
jgi:hypothetical protein